MTNRTKDWFNIFRHKDDFVPHSPRLIHNSIDSDRSLRTVSTTAVPADAILWNGIAWTSDGDAMYIDPDSSPLLRWGGDILMWDVDELTWGT